MTFLPVDADGSLDLHLLDKSIRPDTALVSVMWANNETGVVFPIEEIAAICHSKNVLFHTDATQVPGKMKIDVKALDVDLLTLSAHKLHAPKGVGLLYVKRRTKFQPYLIGGHQERGRRAGTENVAGIVAFGRAAELALANLQDENTRVRALRDRLENTILPPSPTPSATAPRSRACPTPATSPSTFVEAEAILLLLDQLGVCASSGSACTTGSLDPSHVLTAMGIKPGPRARAASVSAWAFTTPGRRWITSCNTCRASSPICGRPPRIPRTNRANPGTRRRIPLLAIDRRVFPITFQPIL